MNTPTQPYTPAIDDIPVDHPDHTPEMRKLLARILAAGGSTSPFPDPEMGSRYEIVGVLDHETGGGYVWLDAPRDPDYPEDVDGPLAGFAVLRTDPDGVGFYEVAEFDTQPECREWIAQVRAATAATSSLRALSLALRTRDRCVCVVSVLDIRCRPLDDIVNTAASLMEFDDADRARVASVVVRWRTPDGLSFDRRYDGSFAKGWR